MDFEELDCIDYDKINRCIKEILDDDEIKDKYIIWVAQCSYRGGKTIIVKVPCPDISVKMFYHKPITLVIESNRSCYKTIQYVHYSVN